MLRQEIISKWNQLKEIIKNGFDKPYHWGQLLRSLQIRSLDPQLTLEKVVEEIKVVWITKTKAEETTNLEKAKAVASFQKTIRDLKDEANRTIRISVTEEDIGGGLIRQHRDFSCFKTAFESLRNKINRIDPDDSGPTIEEVD